MFFPDSALSPGFGRGDEDLSSIGRSRDSLSPYEQQLLQLQKQLDIECKVKQGADNMIAEYSSSAHGSSGAGGSSSKDTKRLLSEAQQMSADSRAKMEYLRMKLKKLQAAHEEERGMLGQHPHDGSDAAEGGGAGGDDQHPGQGGRLQKRGSTEEETLERRIEELRHHLRIESACLEGARNAIKLLQAAKAPDKKALGEAQQNIFESSQKLDLIRHSLEVHRQQLPPDSPVASELKAEIESTRQAMSPVVGGSSFSAIGEHNSHHHPSSSSSAAAGATLQAANSLVSSSSAADPPQRPPRVSQHRNSVFSRTASVTGKLEVR